MAQVQVHESVSTCVTLVDGTNPVLPPICVACGEPAPDCLQYIQDHLPITLPGFAVVSTTSVALPYCPFHSLRFKSRFKRLRFAQLMAYLALLVIVVQNCVRMVINGQRPAEFGVIEGVGMGIAFAFLVLSIFVIKPFLYDVFVRVLRTQVQMRGGHPAFHQALIAANRDVAQTYQQAAPKFVVKRHLFH